MLPSAPHAEGLLPVATSAGAPGDVMTTFTPATEEHPAIVMMDRLLYVPADAGTVAVPPATVTPMNVPAS